MLYYHLHGQLDCLTAATFLSPLIHSGTYFQERFLNFHSRTVNIILNRLLAQENTDCSHAERVCLTPDCILGIAIFYNICLPTIAALTRNPYSVPTLRPSYVQVLQLLSLTLLNVSPFPKWGFCFRWPFSWLLSCINGLKHLLKVLPTYFIK